MHSSQDALRRPARYRVGHRCAGGVSMARQAPASSRPAVGQAFRPWPMTPSHAASCGWTMSSGAALPGYVPNIAQCKAAFRSTWPGKPNLGRVLLVACFEASIVDKALENSLTDFNDPAGMTGAPRAAPQVSQNGRLASSEGMIGSAPFPCRSPACVHFRGFRPDHPW